MNIENQVQNLFDGLKSEKVKEKTETRDVTGFELKKIERNLNKHLQDTKKLKYKPVSIFNYETSSDYDEKNFCKVIDVEIDNKFMQKKWTSMPLFYKWKLVQKHLYELGIVDTRSIKAIKDKLAAGSLVVEYDQNEKKITKIEM